MADYLELKWGTLKGWELESPEAIAAMDKILAQPRSMSAAMQRDTPEEKKLICELIDALDADSVFLEWDAKYVSKDEAKRYVMEYGR